MKPGNRGERGFTLIETLITVFLMAMMFIGLRYTLASWWEVIDRSMTERYVEQYGNSVVEYIARNVINATDISVQTFGTFSTFYVGINSDTLGYYQDVYSASPNNGVTINGVPLFSEFPLPENRLTHNSIHSVMSPLETVEITEFILADSGKFVGLTLIIRYIKEADESNEEDYERNMMFTSQVSLKNRH